MSIGVIIVQTQKNDGKMGRNNSITIFEINNYRFAVAAKNVIETVVFNSYYELPFEHESVMGLVKYRDLYLTLLSGKKMLFKRTESMPSTTTDENKKTKVLALILDNGQYIVAFTVDSILNIITTELSGKKNNIPKTINEQLILEVLTLKTSKNKMAETIYLIDLDKLLPKEYGEALTQSITTQTSSKEDIEEDDFDIDQFTLKE